MNPEEEENLCRVIYETLNHARERCELLEGKDRYALQNELLEWMTGDWEEMEVDWLEKLKEEE